MFGNKESGWAMIAHKIQSPHSHCVPNNQSWEGKLVQVIEKSKSGDCLCLQEEYGMAMIEACDILVFLPVVKKSGFFYSTDLTITQEMNWGCMAMNFAEYYNSAFILFATKNQKIPKNEDFRTLYKMCEHPTPELILFHEQVKNFTKN